jgi:hypothetical protein
MTVSRIMDVSVLELRDICRYNLPSARSSATV